MITSCSNRCWRRSIGACTLLTVAITSAAGAAAVKVKIKDALKELQVGLTLESPPAEILGRYSGPVRISLGDVVDIGYAETDDFLGVGPNAGYRVTLATSRRDALRQALTDALAATGLAAATEDAAVYRLDATLLRDRYSYDGDRLRAEVIVEFDFRGDSGSVGRVITYGNAEALYSPQYDKSLTSVHTLCESALHDMLGKLVDSEVFRQLVGEGWTPGSPSTVLAEDISHIDQSLAYLPAEHWPEVDELAKALAGRNYQRMVVQDFEILDKEFLQKAHRLEEEVCGSKKDAKEKSGLGKRIGKGALTFYTLGLNKKVAKKLDKENKTDAGWACDGLVAEYGADDSAALAAAAQEKRKGGKLKRTLSRAPARSAAAKMGQSAEAGRMHTSMKAALNMGVRPRRLARECVPGLVHEHLDAYYPGAFAAIEHRAEWEPAEALVVTGEIHRFNMGSGSTRLVADVQFKDGMSGETLYSFPVELGEKAMNWKTGVMTALSMGLAGSMGGSTFLMYHNIPPAMRDMEDDVARGVAYMLVESLRPDYEPPSDVEIAFDERSRLATLGPIASDSTVQAESVEDISGVGAHFVGAYRGTPLKMP